MMSDNYHYEDGAIHHDHKQVLHIGRVSSGDVKGLISAFFKDRTEEAEVMEMKEAEVPRMRPTINVPPKTYGNTPILSALRQKILIRLLTLADKGDWVKDGVTEKIKAMLRTGLGYGDTPLTGKEAELSEKMWHLLENGRGDRVRIVWQNLVGYFAEKGFFPCGKGSPALNKMFFGASAEDYQNIDKGRKTATMSEGFKAIVPLLEELLA